ncbi:hypothetical protein [Candidatus Sororendozoicomonas aggregata]|uniref:hypothetical protein n=1 Tax=Candidatus Sororendozoicomonas aggregata TaxID=3073239 RepID=UPI002ED3D0F7
MSIINGSLFTDIEKFHKPEHNANTAAIVIDEKDKKWASETVENSLTRKQSQQETLRFCKQLGCKIIVVHEHRESYPRHIYGVIGNPDWSCIKHSLGVIDGRTSRPLMPYLKKEAITSLVLMGGSYALCIQASLIGICSYGMRHSGILNHQITVLSSPSLLAPYHPGIYSLSPEFSPSARSFNNENADFNYFNRPSWPVFTLHPGMRLYTKIYP